MPPPKTPGSLIITASEDPPNEPVGVNLGSGRCGVDVGSVWVDVWGIRGRSEVELDSIRGRPEAGLVSNLASTRGRSGVDSAWISGRSGAELSSDHGRSGIDLGPATGARGRVGVVLGMFSGRPLWQYQTFPPTSERPDESALATAAPVEGDARRSPARPAADERKPSGCESKPRDDHGA